MKKTKFWARFFLVATLVTAALIFWFSAQKGATSSVLSDRITRQLAKIIKPGYKKMKRRARKSYLERLSTIIRKNAHFCEFMLLGFNLMGYTRFQDPEMSERKCRLRAWGFATAYAVFDELHQLFVDARSAQVTDVLIDSLGSLAGTLVMTLGLALLTRIVQKYQIGRAHV